jgi:hypothetical protein
MAAGQQTGQQAFNRPVLADDDLLHLKQQLFEYCRIWLRRIALSLWGSSCRGR